MLVLTALDATHCDLFPQTASCKCYFFDNLGKFSPKPADDASNQGFNDILRRRFLRQGFFLLQSHHPSYVLLLLLLLDTIEFDCL